ncbi:MAG: VWA domain-containing protein, partial [Flavobacteriales bacterium]
ASFCKKYQNEQEKLFNTVQDAKNALNKINIPDTVVEYAGNIAIKHKTEGLRADILIVKAARAYASLNSTNEVTEKDVDKVAPFILNHRSNSSEDMSPPNNSEDDNSSNEENDQDSETNGQFSYASGENQNESEQQFNPVSNENPLNLMNEQNRSQKRGRAIEVKDTARGINSPYYKEENYSVDVKDTVKYRAIHDKTKIHYKTKKGKTGVLVIFLVDSSGSMAKEKQIAHVKGVVNETVQKNKYSRIRYSLVSLFQGDAVIQTQPTVHYNQLINDLYELKTGGKTNMCAGLKKVKKVIGSPGSLIDSKNDKVCLYIFTDGKFNVGGEDPFKASISEFKKHLGRINKPEVIDIESGLVKLGLAEKFANSIGAGFVNL